MGSKVTSGRRTGAGRKVNPSTDSSSKCQDKKDQEVDAETKLVQDQTGDK